jgi:hypothetical protein
MADAFVSYASPDRDAAFRIVEFLESHGVSCWVAPRDVSPGMEYGEAIIRGIEDSRVLVLILSEESNNSQFVRKEVERAVSKVKPVLPVRIREVAPSGSLEFFIASAQWIDAFKTPMESQLTPLVQAIRGLVGPVGASGAATPVRSTTGPLVRRLSVTVIALGVFGGLLGAGVTTWGFFAWRAAAARSDVGFLVGSWCERSNQWLIRHDVVRLGPDTLRGFSYHSHSSTVGDYRVRVKVLPDGFEIAAFGEGTGPDDTVQFRVIDDATILIVAEGGKPMDPPVPRHRCAPDTRS